MKSTKSSFIHDEIILQGMFYCPYGKEKPTCFFQWLQKKPTAEKIAWFNSLSLRDKQDLMYCHLKCTNKSNSRPEKIKFYQKN
jgi:hypothetical protein